MIERKKPKPHLFQVEERVGSYLLWNDYQQQLLQLQKVTFADLIGVKMDSEWAARQLEYELTSPETTAFLLLSQGALIGLTSFHHTGYPNKFQEQEQLHLGIRESAYRDMQQHSATIGWTAILSEFRGQGGWTQLMNALDARVAGRGFQYMLRWVRLANNYAEKVESRYREQIVFRGEHICDIFGPQKYFRVST